MGCLKLHNFHSDDKIFSDYTPKLEVVRDILHVEKMEVEKLGNIAHYADYYPYGMLMPGRHGEADNSDYRYGFNGMEKDDEVKGEGNSYTTEFRSYDSRLGRWSSLDPLAGAFPWQSPYVAFDNNPIMLTDPRGLAAGGGDPPGSATLGDVMRVAETMSEEKEYINALDKVIIKGYDNLLEITDQLAKLELYYSTGDISSNPIIKAYNIILNRPMIAAYADEGVIATNKLNNLITQRNKHAKLYNKKLSEISSEIGDINVIQSISYEGLNITSLNYLVKNNSSTSNSQLNIVINGNLSSFGGENLGGIDIYLSDATVLSTVPMNTAFMDAMLGSRTSGPKVPRKRSTKIGKTTSVPAMKHAFLSNLNSKQVMVKSSATTELTIYHKPFDVNKFNSLVGGNNWNKFLKVQTGSYKGASWMKNASSDYFYYKNLGLIK